MTASLSQSSASPATRGNAPAGSASAAGTGAPITVLSPLTVTALDGAAGPATGDVGSASPGSAHGTTPTTAGAAPTTQPAVTSGAPAATDPTGGATARSGPVPSGTVVVIDPGHNGANGEHPEIINKLVPAGFGLTKPCNTAGTATNAGYPEHEFTWKVALALRELLQASGITVVMTRDSDTGVGPCVNERAAIGNEARAAAVISIHGDGEASGVHGFVVMTASRAPAGAEMASKTGSLAVAVRRGLISGGFPVSTLLGTDGLWRRGDLAGLNLSLRPTVMIECGNMRNAAEAGVMTSAAGQRQYARGIAAGVLAFLGR